MSCYVRVRDSRTICVDIDGVVVDNDDVGDNVVGDNLVVVGKQPEASSMLTESKQDSVEVVVEHPLVLQHLRLS